MCKVKVEEYEVDFIEENKKFAFAKKPKNTIWSPNFLLSVHLGTSIVANIVYELIKTRKDTSCCHQHHLHLHKVKQNHYENNIITAK